MHSYTALCPRRTLGMEMRPDNCRLKLIIFTLVLFMRDGLNHPKKNVILLKQGILVDSDGITENLEF